MSEPLPPPYDRAKLVELFGEDPATLAEVERDFLDTARGAEREIRGTVDCLVISRAAHRLKGASGMIGAVTLHRLSETIERLAKAGDLASARRLFDMLSQEVRRVAEQVGSR